MSTPNHRKLTMENETVNGKKHVIKAAISDYAPADLYCADHMMHNGMDISRFVAYTQNPDTMSQLIKKVVKLLPESLEILVRVQKNPENPDEWTRYYAESTRERVLREYDNNLEFILHDGTNQFFVKDPESGDYFTLDDHGVLFIYSIDTRYEDILESMSFERHAEITLFDKPHEHLIRDDAPELLQKMVAGFGLEEV